MKRVFGFDLIRTIAVVMVLSVHFFLNNGFYQTKVTGKGMFFSIFLFWIFYNGVPLFLLLTGYLKKDKKLNKEYYKGIKHILMSYILIAITCLIVRKFYFEDKMTFLSAFTSIFNFSANGYSWYIEMYLGLFLIIPFLNVLYNHLETKKQKQTLILTLMFIISLSPLFNYIKVNDVYLTFGIDWWNQIYPLLYYFIGCYIHEYRPKINRKKGLLIIFSIVLLESLLCYGYSYNKLFNCNFLGGYNSLQTVIVSTIIFLLLYEIQYDKKIITKIVNKISMLSLDIYLFSYIVDRIVYQYLSKYLSNPVAFLKFFPLIVALNFLLSFLLSYIKEIIMKIGKQGASILHFQFIKRK